MTRDVSKPPFCSDKAIWCGIPVYNNAATIADVARRCREQIANVVIVDDGSTDADLRSLCGSLGVSVVRHATNLGKGAALLTAFRYAADRGAEYLIALDGDGQHFPEDIPLFIPRLAPDAVLIGYRHQVIGAMPRSSRFGREFSDFWIQVESGRDVRDSQSGFRGYPLKSILGLKLNSRHYNFEMEILTKALWAGLRAQTIMIRVWYPPSDVRVSSFKTFRDNIRISLLHARLVSRQLLPIPHQCVRGLSTTVSLRSSTLGSICMEHSTPLGLAAAVAVSLLLSILLWPYGVLAVAYVTARLHLNKIVALVCVAACMLPALALFCEAVGHRVIRNEANPRLEWFVGSHIVAFAIAPASAWLVYAIASRFQNIERVEHLSAKGNEG